MPARIAEGLLKLSVGKAGIDRIRTRTLEILFPYARYSLAVELNLFKKLRRFVNVLGDEPWPDDGAKIKDRKLLFGVGRALVRLGRRMKDSLHLFHICALLQRPHQRRRSQ